MSFEDLPPGWRERPITEPALLPDVLDLVVSERDRRRGALYALICDEEGRLMVPVAISDDRPVVAEERPAMAHGLVRTVAQVGPGLGLLVAIARRQGLSLRPEDHDWARLIAEECGEDVRLLGVHVVTLDGSREVPRVAPAA